MYTHTRARACVCMKERKQLENRGLRMAKTALDTFTKEERQDIFAGLEIRRGALIKNIMPSGIPCICRCYMDIRRRISRPNVSETLGAAGYHPERVKSPEGSAGEIPCWWSGSFRNLHCDTYILASPYPFPCRPQPLSLLVRSSGAFPASLSRSFFPYFAL